MTTSVQSPSGVRHRLAEQESRLSRLDRARQMTPMPRTWCGKDVTLAWDREYEPGFEPITDCRKCFGVRSRA